MKDNPLSLISNKLGIDSKKVKEGIQRDIIKEEDMHFRFNKKYTGVTRGTCVFKNGEVIPGFPKIRRAMVLSPTIQKNFGDQVVVEEKMNGYNVRIAKIKEKILGLTRSGIICPYTTRKAREKIDLSFFEKNPDLYICGEMVGPDNPYVPTNIYDVASLDFFVFDIRKKNSGEQLSVHNRRETTKNFKIKNVRLFGKFESEKSAKKVKEITKKLGEEKREGVVIKDPRTELDPIKYTSSQSNCSDLEYAYRFYHDYGSDFVHSRTVREGFQSHEWGENKQKLEERAKRIGLNILEPMIKTIRKKDEGETITETVRIKVSNLELADKFINHLKKRGIETDVSKIEELENNDFRVYIEKLQGSTNDKTQSLLNGGLW